MVQIAKQESFDITWMEFTNFFGSEAEWVLLFSFPFSFVRGVTSSNKWKALNDLGIPIVIWKRDLFFDHSETLNLLS
jgi:hypothetical protein